MKSPRRALSHPTDSMTDLIRHVPALQGFATGMAITTLAAIILDTDKERAPLLNSFTAFAGLSAGTLGAGALVTFAPAPEQLVFVVLLVLSVVEAAILWFMPETARTRPGALASLRPRVHVPRVARRVRCRHAGQHRLMVPSLDFSNPTSIGG